jgi:prephenate dehydrogenase
LRQRTFGVIGLGMMGGSLARAAARAGWQVIGYDTNAKALQEALDSGAIGAALTRSELYAKADTVAIATHIDGTLAEIARLPSESPHAQLVFDIASVKAAIVKAAEGIPRFVASHPMAGTEKIGVAGSRAEMFDGRTWAYVPSENDARMRALIAEFGATPVAIDAVLHDKAVALSSHLPQALAVAFAERMNGRDARIGDPLLGPTAREFLRLAKPNQAMWRGIFEHNAENIAEEMRAMARALDSAADKLT